MCRRYRLRSIRPSVLTPLTIEHLIVARSPTLTPLSLATRSPVTAHVSPPTVIDVEETAETVPCASLRSVIALVLAHRPAPSSTAEPPAVLPPIFPAVNPPVAL